MRTLTFTQVFAGRHWSIGAVANYIDSTVFEGQTTVLAVEAFDFSIRSAMDISAALAQFSESVYPEVVAFNITIAESDVETYADFFNRTVEQLEIDFYGEWRTV